MLNVQSHWGENLGVDLLRLAAALKTSRNPKSSKNKGTTLYAPSHELYNPSGQLKFDVVGKPTNDLIHDEHASPLGDIDLNSVMMGLKPFLPLILPKPEKKNHPASDELVLYIDSSLGGFGYRADIDNVPPPLAYYRYVIETRYWKKVTIAIPPSASNLFVKHLKHFYPKINIHTGSAPERWQYMLDANNLVIGSDLFGKTSALLSERLKRLWVPEYSAADEYLVAHKAKVYPIKIVDYIDRDSWFGGIDQIATICNHPESKILDETKWIFTESEKCRSFKYCQSCRDTTAIGKLWRSVIAERFEVPTRDWECPHGWKWGGVPGWALRLKRALGIGTIIKRTTSVLGVKPCTACLDREARYDGKRA